MFRYTLDHSYTAEDGSDPIPMDETVDEMPLYGAERAMGVDNTIPSGFPLIRFRVYDDDGDLMGEGELHDDPECENQSAALRWAETMWGCTRIEVCRVQTLGNSTMETWRQEIG